jgi:hypothetical protein
MLGSHPAEACDYSAVVSHFQRSGAYMGNFAKALNDESRCLVISSAIVELQAAIDLFSACDPADPELIASKRTLSQMMGDKAGVCH